MSYEERSQQGDIDYCLRREREERLAASTARNADVRDDHIMAAERFADRAWSLGETDSTAFVPSSLWA